MKGDTHSLLQGVTFMIYVLILQVDLVAQGDSVYDIIDASDHFIMRNNLSTSTSLEMGELSEKKRLNEVKGLYF